MRYRATADPRLTPASTVRLLDDPNDRVRYAATEESAAEHPSLPVPVMERMLRWGAPLGHPVLDL